MTGWLLDTQLLVWSGYAPQRLPPILVPELIDPIRDVRFSVVSLWEVAIKASLKRADFRVSPVALRQGLLAAGFAELPIQAEHVLAVPSPATATPCSGWRAETRWRGGTVFSLRARPAQGLEHPRWQHATAQSPPCLAQNSAGVQMA